MKSRMSLSRAPAHASNIQAHASLSVQGRTRSAFQFGHHHERDPPGEREQLWQRRSLFHRSTDLPLPSDSVHEKGAAASRRNNSPGWNASSPTANRSPHWGPGRDDAMNLTKYFMTSMKEDNTLVRRTFPSIWNLGIRSGKDKAGKQMLLNWTGDTPAVRSVLIDSALGLGAPPRPWFLQRMADRRSVISAIFRRHRGHLPRRTRSTRKWRAEGEKIYAARLRFMSRTARRTHKQGDSDRGNWDRR